MAGLFGYFTRRAGNDDPRHTAGCIGDTLLHHDYYRMDVAPAGPTGALGRVHIGRLNSQPQPVQHAERGVTLFLCGELYHQDETRRSLERSNGFRPESDDANLLLHRYLTDGIDALTTIAGMFVAAVWDEPSGDLWIVNDRYGLYPHFFAHTGGSFVLAPEMKAVLAAPEVPRKLDLAAIAQYARFQQILGERTWFEDIQLLPPATVLHYRPDTDRLRMRRYWDWDQIPPQPDNISLSDAADETIRLFDRAVEAMVRPPMRVGVFLSGGLDGRAILGFARDRVDVSTFTFGAPDCRDVHYAGKIAESSKSDHYWFPLEDGHWVLDHAAEHLNLTEGQHSWMHAHGISMLSTARHLIDVNLSGWDGGTILGGFLVAPERDDYYRSPANEEQFARRIYSGLCQEFVWPGLTNPEADQLFSHPGNKNLRDLAYETLKDELARTAHYPLPNRADYFYILQHCRRSTQNMIVFTRSAVEVRCPYFDYDLVSFLYGLPARLRSSLDLQHLVLTRRMPDLARIPNEKDQLPPHASRALRSTHRAAGLARRTANRVGPVFKERPRLYADYEHYLRTDLADWAQEILFAPRSLDRGIFNPSAVRDLWEQHQRGDRLWTIGKLAPLMTIELVLRQYFDSSPDDNPARSSILHSEPLQSTDSG